MRTEAAQELLTKTVPFQDRWGRWHDKSCANGDPPSNNGWIYTAYAQKLGFPILDEGLKNCFEQCCLYAGQKLPCHRSPRKPLPPMSRDEILGLYWLKLLSIDDLIKFQWRFSPYTIPAFNLFKTFGALWRMRKADRNALWKRDGEPHLYRFAFSVPIQDRAYMLRDSNKKVPWVYRSYEWLSNLSSSKSKSSRLIDWRKGDFPASADLFKEYFGEAHPFVIKLTKASCPEAP